jgi:hypothetical protein
LFSEFSRILLVEIWMFNFKMSSQIVLFQNVYTLFTCHAYDATLFSTKHHFTVHCS